MLVLATIQHDEHHLIIIKDRMVDLDLKVIIGFLQMGL